MPINDYNVTIGWVSYRSTYTMGSNEHEGKLYRFYEKLVASHFWLLRVSQQISVFLRERLEWKKKKVSKIIINERFRCASNYGFSLRRYIWYTTTHTFTVLRGYHLLSILLFRQLSVANRILSFRCLSDVIFYCCWILMIMIDVCLFRVKTFIPLSPSLANTKNNHFSQIPLNC